MIINAATADLIRGAAEVLRRSPSLDPAEAVRVAMDGGGFCRDDERVASAVLAEMGVERAVEIADREFPPVRIPPGRALFEEFVAEWTAVPFRNPDVGAFLARAEEYGREEVMYLRGALEAFMLYGPSPTLSEDQLAERDEMIEKVMERVKRDREVDEWTGLGDDSA